MAIRQTLTREKTEIRAALPEAYLRVHDVEIRLSAGGQVWIHLLTYADRQARQDPDACAVNKTTVRLSLQRFVEAGKPSGWTRDEIIAAAYRAIKAEGYTGEDC